MNNDGRDIFDYHERTKHRFGGYARSLGYMDWANQPVPFRIYSGVHTVRLPLMETDSAADHAALYTRQGQGTHAVNLANVAGFLELSMGLSAWKAIGDSRWALRMNPSSGNLHPTEAYLVLPSMAGLAAGVYHYNPLVHALERRAELPDALWRQLHGHFKTAGFLVGLTSIFWRESWKYGERAFRYCNHDVGHAVAGISVAAGLNDWKTTVLNALSDDQIETVLGLSRTGGFPQEKEHPDLVCLVHDQAAPEIPGSLPAESIDAFRRLTWQGTPNRLSKETVAWELIDQAAALTRKPATPAQAVRFHAAEPVSGAASALSATRIIRQRRSATAFVPDRKIPSASFLSMMDKTLPRNDTAPFDVALDVPMVHLLLFIHNVTDIPRGLYLLIRNTDHAAEIRGLTHPEFLWEPATPGLPLYCLKKGDFRAEAAELCCHQDIAGSSAFSLGMIANFRATIENEPFRYRQRYWECGMIGQVLYLEAEAMGVRGTGIGCFFDDPVHDMLGLPDNRYQSLYHFTVGVPVEDPKLTTFPPYFHLEKNGAS